MYAGKKSQILTISIILDVHDATKTVIHEL